jgi:tRNA uridine 5-carboxymethylaminomethyl modification enzyme
VRQPGGGYAALRPLGEARLEGLEAEALEIRLRYAGYLEREERMVARVRALEDRALPEALWTAPLRGLSREAVEKLRAVRPRTVGQAGRVPGVSPADITVLLILLRGIEAMEMTP